MKASRFHRTGGPDVLVYEDVADPGPRAGEVLIRVEAVGLNFTDVMRRRGDDYPIRRRRPSPWELRSLERSQPSGPASPVESTNT